MASNPDENSAQNRNNGRKSNGSNFARRNWHGANRDTGPRQRPVAVLIPQVSSSSLPNPAQSLDSGHPTVSSASTERLAKTSSYRINRKSGPYHGWQLYFPEIGMLEILTCAQWNMNQI